MSLGEDFDRWVTSASQTDLRRLFATIRADPGFTRDFEWLPRARVLSRQHRWDEVIELVDLHMPSAIMSPTAHRLLAQASDGIHDRTRATREWTWTDLGLSAITTSGKGTPDAPWQVLHLADEYTWLHEAGRTPLRQEVAVVNGRHLDRIICAEDFEGWFDLG